jgi:hypothetical protein
MYALLRAFEAAQADEQRDAIEELLPHVVTLAMHQTGTKVSCRRGPMDALSRRLTALFNLPERRYNG